MTQSELPTMMMQHESSFRHALGVALSAAARAPSSHNCQPWGVAWLVSERAEQRLVIALDEARTLRALPAHALEMELSCGAYRYALTDALARLGYVSEQVLYHEVQPPYSELTEWPASWRALCTITLTRRATIEPMNQALPERTTNRAPYRTTPLSDEIVRELSRGDGVARVEVIQERQQIDAAARVANQYGALEYEHASAWFETYHALRFSKVDLTDGLPVTQMLGQLPDFAVSGLRVILSPPVMSMLRRIAVPKLLTRQTAALFARAPALLVLSFVDPQPTLEQRLSAGGTLLQTWQCAARHGLALHPLSVLTQHLESRRALQDALGLSRAPIFFARIGYPTIRFPPAPKRTPEDALCVLREAR